MYIYVSTLFSFKYCPFNLIKLNSMLKLVLNFLVFCKNYLGNPLLGPPPPIYKKFFSSPTHPSTLFEEN